jgi:hypothetical protein
MSKKYAIFLSALFCAALGVFVVWNLLTPDRTFSPNENTYLQQRPKLTLSRVLSGEFMSDYEEYVTDQFAGRDGWVALKALSERALGKTENNGVYFGTDGQTLFAGFDPPDAALVEKNLNYVNQFVESAGIPVYFSLIPGKDALWGDRLPANAPVGDQFALLSQASSSTAAQWIDVSQALQAHAQDADPAIYYRLDHHWTTYGAYWGYAALMKSMGVQPVPLEQYTPTTVSTSFNGTTYSSSGVRWLDSDEIQIYVPEDGVTVTSYLTADAQGNLIPSEGALYDYSYLEEKDKYSMFLGGQQPVCVIETQSDGPRLLLIRDSFSDSLAPYLTAHFSQIHLIDLRYYKASLTDYIRDNQIDQALVLYSVANFVSDNNLFVLGRG